MQSIVLLHPGAMGASIGRALVAGGNEVRWVSEARSPATRRRADETGLTETESLASSLKGADLVFSVCPPAAAGDVATSVGRLGFSGVYVDANAIAPDTSRRIGDNLVSCGATFVDGGIVGPPALTPGTTRLYLSGPQAARVASLFEDTMVEVQVVDDRPGSASALKVCFAAWTKGSAALLLAIRALAEREGVTSTLLDEWATSIPELVERSERVAGSALKAWRFAPEMEEIAATFRAAGLPSGFHQAAADLFGRLAVYKDADPVPTLAEVIERLTAAGETPPRRSRPD